MKKITLKVIRQYFKVMGFTPRHNLTAIKKAINKLNEEIQTDAYDLLLLILQNKPIDGLHTHSYGFHTSNGRYMIETFKDYYNEYDKS